MLYGEKTIVIGTYTETEREINHCPSYYAADHETLRTIPGEYEARLTFVGGYMVPMPYWLLIGIDSVRVSGALYSGCGGKIFGKTELPAGEKKTYTIQANREAIQTMVAKGKLVLRPGLEWLLEDCCWNHPSAPKTWDDFSKLPN